MCVCVCVYCVRVFHIFRNFLPVLGRDPREAAVTFISCQIQLNARISCFRSSLFLDFTQCRLIGG